MIHIGIEVDVDHFLKTIALYSVQRLMIISHLAMAVNFSEKVKKIASSIIIDVKAFILIFHIIGAVSDERGLQEG